MTDIYADTARDIFDKVEDEITDHRAHWRVKLLVRQQIAEVLKDKDARIKQLELVLERTADKLYRYVIDYPDADALCILDQCDRVLLREQATVGGSNQPDLLG